MPAKRCLLCHAVNEPHLRVCDGCGHELDQLGPLDSTRGVLEHRRSTARSAFIGFVVLDLAMLALCGVGAYFGVAVVPLLLLFGLLVATYRAKIRLDAARDGLHALDQRDATLPRATALS